MSNQIKQQMDRLASELGLPFLDIDGDKLAHLMRSSPKVQAVKDFLAFIDSKKVKLVNASGGQMSEQEASNLVLEFVGVDIEDAIKVSKYVIDSVHLLNDKAR